MWYNEERSGSSVKGVRIFPFWSKVKSGSRVKTEKAMTRKLKWGMLFLWLAAFNSAASAQIINRENIESKFTLDVPIPELDDFGLEYEHLDRWDGFFNERTQTHNQIFLRYSLPALEKWSVGVGYRRKTTDLQNGGRENSDSQENAFQEFGGID